MHHMVHQRQQLCHSPLADTLLYLRMIISLPVLTDYHQHINISDWTSPVSFAYAGPPPWNSLPDNLNNVNLSLQTFKRHLKTFFFPSYEHIQCI